MSKDNNLLSINKCYSLDTLEVTSELFKSKSHESLYKSTLHKHSTIKKLVQLIDISDKAQQKKYWKTYHCKNVLLQNGNKFTGSLCRKRWCQTCNRIKTAEMTNAYLPSFEKLKEIDKLYFVTLTAPTIAARQMKKEINKRYKVFTLIKDNLRKQGVKLNGMRKLEITYNEVNDKYHPHFHFIQQGYAESKMLLDSWLKHFPNASINAQDIKEVSQGSDSLIELMKYATKDIVKDTTSAIAYNNIQKAIEGVRIFQPYGKLRKVKAPKEEKEEILNADFIAPKLEIYVYDQNSKDYFNAKDECLINTKEIELRLKTKL